MFIEKNTYVCIEENKDAMLESFHDYFKNIYFMKALSQALGPTFPGNTSTERIQLLNVFYLNAFNSLVSDQTRLNDVKKALKKLIGLIMQDYRANPEVFTKIMFVCGMFKEHYKINLTGIPNNMLEYIHDNLDAYTNGITEWGKE